MSIGRAGALDRALAARRPRIDRWLRWTSVALAIAALVVAVLSPDRAARRYWAVFVAPMLAAAPYWVRRRLARLERIPTAARVLDGVVFLAALLRFVDVGGVPASGHTLFLTHTMVSVREPRWRVIAAALLVMTSWFKLAVWHDPQTWAVGIVAGLVTGVLARVAERTHRSDA